MFALDYGRLMGGPFDCTQELKCQPFLLELLVDDGPTRLGAARLRDGCGREQAPFDQCFVSVLRPGPGKASLIRAGLDIRPVVSMRFPTFSRPT